MRNRVANYVIDMQSEHMVLLRDVGPWTQYPTITNSAEEVVEDLVKKGVYKEDMRILYVDSEGEMTGLFVVDGKFKHFITFAEAA